MNKCFVYYRIDSTFFTDEELDQLKMSRDMIGLILRYMTFEAYVIELNDHSCLIKFDKSNDDRFLNLYGQIRRRLSGNSDTFFINYKDANKIIDNRLVSSYSFSLSDLDKYWRS